MGLGNFVWFGAVYTKVQYFCYTIVAVTDKYVLGWHVGCLINRYRCEFEVDRAIAYFLVRHMHFYRFIEWQASNQHFVRLKKALRETIRSDMIVIHDKVFQRMVLGSTTFSLVYTYSGRVYSVISNLRVAIIWIAIMIHLFMGISIFKLYGYIQYITDDGMYYILYMGKWTPATQFQADDT